MKANYNDLAYVTNQYNMAKRHKNWERAYLLEERMHKLQKKIYGCLWNTSYRKDYDGKKLVTIIIN